MPEDWCEVILDCEVRQVCFALKLTLTIDEEG